MPVQAVDQGLKTEYKTKPTKWYKTLGSVFSDTGM